MSAAPLADIQYCLSCGDVISDPIIKRGSNYGKLKDYCGRQCSWDKYKWKAARQRAALLGRDYPVKGDV